MKLIEGVNQFISHKRSSGLAYERAAARLTVFSKRIGDVDLSQIQTEDLEVYFTQFASRSSESVAKYLQLSRFFQYWQLRGEMGPLTLPRKPIRVRQSFQPYIFNANEIRTLLFCTTRAQRRASCLIDGPTFRVFILLMYATGASASELIALRRADVNLVTRRLSLNGGWRSKTRDIPIGVDLRKVLAEYCRGRFQNAQSILPLFCDKRGLRVRTRLATYNFNRLCKVANVCRRDGVNRSPRLLDLKSTFAVNRISMWIKEGLNLNRMLPALAIYMGQAGLGATQSYLRLTPERLRASLDLLSPAVPKMGWRCNPLLMEYLNSLSSHNENSALPD